MARAEQGIMFFSMEKETKLSIRNRIFVNSIVPAVKTVEFFSDRVSYICSSERSLM